MLLQSRLPLRRQRKLLSLLLVISLILVSLSNVHLAKASAGFVSYTLTCSQLTATGHTDQDYGAFQVFVPAGSDNTSDNTYGEKFQATDGTYSGTVTFPEQPEGTEIQFNAYGSDADGNWDNGADERLNEKCSSAGVSFNLPTNSETETPTRPAATLPFYDDFSDPNNPNQWGLADSENLSMNLNQSKFTFTMKGVNAPISVPELSFPGDIDITVKAQATSLSQKWDYGIMLRSDIHTNRDHQEYFYLIDVEGNWSIIHSQLDSNTGSWHSTVLIGGTLQGFQPTANNQLRAVAVGTRLAFFVNGNKVGEVEDDKIPANGMYAVGLSAENFNNPDRLTTIDFTGFFAEAAIYAAVLPFVEDFSDLNNPNQWNLGFFPHLVPTLNNGKLTYTLSDSNGTENGVGIRSYPRLTFPGNVDISVNVKVTPLSKKGKWVYFIFLRGFRGIDGFEFHYYNIQSDGQWSITSFRNRTQTTLIEGTLKGFQVTADNTLRAVAVGTRLTFFVNGKKVGEVEDSTLPANDMVLCGVGMSNFDASASADFTKFIVVAP